MLNRIFFVLILLFSIACTYKTKSKLIQNNEKDLIDDQFYYNQDLSFKIGAKYNGWEHDVENISLPEIDLLRLPSYEFRELLHSMRQFDRFFFYAERYKKRPDLSILTHLKSRGFQEISVLDTLTCHLEYQFQMTNQTFYIEEKSRKVKGSYIRYIMYTKVIETAYLPEDYVDFEREQLKEMLHFAYDFDSLYYADIELDMSNMGWEEPYYDKSFDKPKYIVNKEWSLYSNIDNNNMLKSQLNKKNSVVFDTLLEGAKVYSLDAKIPELAKNSDFLCFNENHFSPSCRNNVRNVITVLKNYGFSHLLIEALPQGLEISPSDFVTNNLGIYTNEPTFGNLLRHAKESGFTTYGYEYDPSEITTESNESRHQFRERKQAENILALVEKNNIQKGVIFGGFDHIRKKSIGLIQPMAKFLADRLEKSIITIDQTTFFGHEKELIQLLNLNDNTPYLISSQNIRQLGYDYILLEYNESYATNAPSFIFDLGDKEVFLTELGCNLEKNNIIFVYALTENIKYEIPLMVFQLDEDKSYKVYLPIGSYLIQEYSGNKIFKCENVINIK